MKTHEVIQLWSERIFRKNCFETNKLNFLAIIFYRRWNICDCNETDFYRNSSTPWMKCHSWISLPKRAAFQRENENRFDWKFSFCWKLQIVRKQQNCAIQSFAKENKMQNWRPLHKMLQISIRQLRLAFLFLIGKLQFPKFEIQTRWKTAEKCLFFLRLEGFLCEEISQWSFPRIFDFSWKCFDSRAKRFSHAKTHGTTSSRVYNSDEYNLRSLCFAKDFPIIICFLSSTREWKAGFRRNNLPVRYCEIGAS